MRTSRVIFFFLLTVNFVWAQETRVIKSQDGREYKATFHVVELDKKEKPKKEKVKKEKVKPVKEKRVTPPEPIESTVVQERVVEAPVVQPVRETYVPDQSYRNEPVGYDSPFFPIQVAVNYEVSPIGGISDFIHYGGVQVSISNFILDGTVGNFRNGIDVTSSSEEEKMFIDWSVNVGYKVNLNDKFAVYPMVGIAQMYHISDDFTVNYGVGMHYKINDFIFLNYKFTRHTAGVGVGFIFN